MNIVIDTNRFMSALIKEGTARNIIMNTKDTLLMPEFEFQEIFKYEEEILEKSGLSEIEFNVLFFNLTNIFKVINIEQIIEYKEEADSIMKNIDSNDSIFVATALAFNYQIGSNDNHFNQQNKIKIMTNKEMIERLE